MQNKDFMKENENAGFSLVELIVVIAIMAVLVAVLAPAVISYVESSRAQKDDSAMAEVANAIQDGMAGDEKIYDEVLAYCISNASACYADGSSTTNNDENKVTISDSDWYYNDNCRDLEGDPWTKAGVMRGVNITFTTDDNNKVDLMGGMFNRLVGDGATAGTAAYVYATPSDAGSATVQNHQLQGTQNHLSSQIATIIGEDGITLGSQTYRNSNYTVFIEITKGVSSATNNTASKGIKVRGEWNGKYLDSKVTV